MMIKAQMTDLDNDNIAKCAVFQILSNPVALYRKVV